MSPQTIHFIRHGQTGWNAEARLQGQADTDIGDLGREQAARNGRRLAELLPDPSGHDFVASPLRRTRETMEIVRRAMGLDPMGYRVEPRLMELHFGDWQGSTYAELEAASPGSTEGRKADKWNFRPPGEAAESYEMLAGRVKPWLDAVDRPTVCVTHGGVIRAVFRLLGGWSSAAAADIDIPQDRVLAWDGARLEWT
ncbi:MAG: phosphoglycerate mutase family protein [Rhizobiaceae bacterium]|nr:phosphoglycerate mutase family protein [Rhizobiaceae bacterium]MCV0405619.1 phosphoglycerate mutase family protein [Rhizobiaceae bacterium]